MISDFLIHTTEIGYFRLHRIYVKVWRVIPFSAWVYVAHESIFSVDFQSEMTPIRRRIATRALTSSPKTSVGQRARIDSDLVETGNISTVAGVGSAILPVHFRLSVRRRF